ncbi:MAG TPA: WecB/TagA/CpsF family glycosyltransferase [Smithellaceae bacterium]|nr:WecB/TagA/CpsF family glycosyltransferase [Smithellaceae bacterium]
MKHENILGYPVAAVSSEVCVDGILKRIGATVEGSAPLPFWLACLNPHSARMAVTDPAAEKALKSADILIPDGIGVVIASQILGGIIRERITGSDIFRDLSRKLNDQGNTSYFLLGSTEETLAVIKARLTMDFPRIRLAGSYSPPFKEVFGEAENQLMIEAVNRAAPDILWVGMTAPKQEKWIHRNKGKLNVKFIGAVGAVFDFYAGNVKRSSPWFLEHGLEWLPRLLQEPRRLWQRTFVSAPLFLLRVLRQRITGKV